MRILATERNLLNPLGGGELSLNSLLVLLKDRNEVLAVANRANGLLIPPNIIDLRLIEIPRTFMVNKYFAFRQVEGHVKRVIKKFAPHLIITQQDFAAATLKAAYDVGTPTVFFARNYEHLCLCGNPESECNRRCADCYGYGIFNPYRFFVERVFEYERRWISKASIIISNSCYMSRVLKEWYGIESSVVYPFITETSIREWKPEYITFINPTRHKGVNVLMEIAKKLSNEKFLVVGHNTESIDLSDHKNITYMPWVDDSAQIYSMTRLLLMPSIWPEPFGRVCVEAGFNGIPTIASNIGGLPEAVGKGGILVDEYRDPNKWIEAIDVLNDPDTYRAYSEIARLHSKRFRARRVFKDFREILERRTGLVV